jgi:flagellar secretion chaperone FliS
VNVETASQGKIIVMLFNGAIKRAEEARRQMLAKRYQEVHNNLIRAQDIIAELRSALDMKVGELAVNLDRIYEYCQHNLIKANLNKVIEPIDESISVMTQMRDTWQEAFAVAAKEQTSPPPVRPVNPHGHSMLNVTS